MNDLKPTKVYPGTPAFKIFNTLWSVRVPKLYLHSDEDLEFYGVRMSGDRRVTEAHLEGVQHVSLSVSDMIRIRRAGGQVWINNPESYIRIYELIQDHLRNWVTVLEAFNYEYKKICPIDDLRDLNDLSLEMLSMANAYYERKDLASLVKEAENRINGLSDAPRRTRRFRFARPTEGYVVTVDDFSDLTSDPSMEDGSTYVDRDPHPLVTRSEFEAKRRGDRIDPGLFKALESLVNYNGGR